MKLTAYLKRTKKSTAHLSKTLGHSDNWLGRVLDGSRALTLVNALGVVYFTDGAVSMADLRMYLSPTSRKALSRAKNAIPARSRIPS